jgi:histidinol phosphatase-like enzyme (inositol monophosphatase family)
VAGSAGTAGAPPATREELERLMQAAADVARLAGDHALGYFRGDVRVEFKADGSPVTAADRGAEERARAWIEERFPGDGILGEELGTVSAGAPRRWIVDPIDGTKTFVRGVPLWGTLVAVAEAESGRVLAGAIYCPAVGELVAAAPQCGAWWNGVRCRVSAVASLRGATVLTTDDRFPSDAGRRAAFARLASEAAVSRTWGDCYGYLLVATGRAEAMVDDRVSPWDAAALVPAIAEAGGVFTDWRGAPTAFGGDAVATNAALAVDVRRALGVPV